MKTIMMTIILAVSATASANVPISRGAASTTSRTTVNFNDRVGSSDNNVHFMTNMVGLFEGKTNVQANFFGLPQLALSINFFQSSEKTEPIKKANAEPGTKWQVTSTQFGVGAAYYIWPTSQKFNVMLNPYILSDRKTDPIEVDNSTGVGLKADGMMRFEDFAFNLGAQYTSTGSSATILNAAVGYIF